MAEFSLPNCRHKAIESICTNCFSEYNRKANAWLETNMEKMIELHDIVKEGIKFRNAMIKHDPLHHATIHTPKGSIVIDVS